MATQMTPCLRCGGLQDIEPIYHLNRQCFSEYWSRQSLYSALESGYDLIICDVDAQPAGYLLSLCVMDEIQIMQVAVAPAWRRQGLARYMTDYLIEHATDVSNLLLEVRASNVAARALYARLGFEEVGCRKQYYTPDAAGVREDALLMSRSAS